MTSATAAIAFGTTSGDPLGILVAVGTELRTRNRRPAAASSLYRTAPCGPSESDFFNAVFVLNDVDPGQPESLLHELLAIEAAIGRNRSGPRWSERIVDLDLIAVRDADGTLVRRETADLILPHPLAGFRPFVLTPTAEIDPMFPVAVATTAHAATTAAVTVGQRSDRLSRRPIRVRCPIAWRPAVPVRGCEFVDADAVVSFVQSDIDAVPLDRVPLPPPEAVAAVLRSIVDPITAVEPAEAVELALANR